MNTQTIFDSKYFTENARLVMEDFFEYDSEKYSFADDLLSEINRFHPDGDISFLDVENKIPGLSEYYSLSNEQLKEVAQELWTAIS